VTEAMEEDRPLITKAKKSDNLLNHCATIIFYKMYLYSEIANDFRRFL
jgi:hypothetical protein